jgi:hypothetical protein
MLIQIVCRKLEGKGALVTARGRSRIILKMRFRKVSC